MKVSAHLVDRQVDIVDLNDSLSQEYIYAF